jgi:hypothetical protein
MSIEHKIYLLPDGTRSVRTRHYDHDFKGFQKALFDLCSEHAIALIAVDRHLIHACTARQHDIDVFRIVDKTDEEYYSGINLRVLAQFGIRNDKL